MRTTVRLDADLLREAKAHAAMTGRTLTSVIEEGLRQVLARRDSVRQATPVMLTTCGGRGLQPGVDLDDSAALLDRMESGPGPMP
jgi:hypothetical protein